MDNSGLYKDDFKCKDGGPLFRIPLGTMYFGTKISQKDADILLDAYLSAGGNQIDTARSYASWIDGRNGSSESVIGNWLQRCGNRPSLFIGTKGGLMPRGYNPSRGNLEKKHLEEELSSSLDSLKTDYVDVFWLHRDEPTRPVEEIIDTCSSFVEKGIVRYIGASNWEENRIELANSYAKATGKCGFSMSQIQFGLGICTPEAWGDSTVVCMNENRYQWYLKNNFPLYAYSSQAQGFFSILIEKGAAALSKDTRKKYLSPANLKRAEKLKEIHNRTGIPVSALVVYYALTQKLDVYPLFGCSRKDRLIDAFRYLDKIIPIDI